MTKIEAQANRVTAASSRQKAAFEKAIALPYGEARRVHLDAFETAKKQMFREAAKLFEMTRARRRLAK